MNAAGLAQVANRLVYHLINPRQLKVWFGLLHDTHQVAGQLVQPLDLGRDRVLPEFGQVPVAAWSTHQLGVGADRGQRRSDFVNQPPDNTGEDLEPLPAMSLLGQAHLRGQILHQQNGTNRCAVIVYQG